MSPNADEGFRDLLLQNLKQIHADVKAVSDQCTDLNDKLFGKDGLNERLSTAENQIKNFRGWLKSGWAALGFLGLDRARDLTQHLFK